MSSLLLRYFLPTWLVTLGLLTAFRRALPLAGPGPWRALPAAALVALGFAPVLLTSKFLDVPVPIPPYLWKETVENQNLAGALRRAAPSFGVGTAVIWLGGRLWAARAAARARSRS